MSPYPSIISQPGSAQRNLDPIVEALSPLVDPLNTESRLNRILELASYPYEHISSFASKWDKVEWWGTCRDSEEIKNVEDRLSADNGQTNLKSPQQLDVSIEKDWDGLRRAIDEIEDTGGVYEGVIMLNLIHCCPVDVPENIFKQLSPYSPSGARLLNPKTGWIAAYGAYKNDDGTYKSAGDEEFDRTYIKAKDPSLGLRSIASISRFAEKYGFVEESRREMPKGNMFVVWRVCT